MSFISNLNLCCGEYTNFIFNGSIFKLPYSMGVKKLQIKLKQLLIIGLEHPQKPLQKSKLTLPTILL